MKSHMQLCWITYSEGAPTSPSSSRSGCAKSAGRSTIEWFCLDTSCQSEGTFVLWWEWDIKETRRGKQRLSKKEKKLKYCTFEENVLHQQLWAIGLFGFSLSFDSLLVQVGRNTECWSIYLTRRHRAGVFSHGFLLSGDLQWLTVAFLLDSILDILQLGLGTIDEWQRDREKWWKMMSGSEYCSGGVELAEGSSFFSLWSFVFFSIFPRFFHQFLSSRSLLPKSIPYWSFLLLSFPPSRFFFSCQCRYSFPYASFALSLFHSLSLFPSSPADHALCFHLILFLFVYLCLQAFCCHLRKDIWVKKKKTSELKLGVQKWEKKTTAT